MYLVFLNICVYMYLVFVNICMHMRAGVSSAGNVDSATFLPATLFCFRQRPSTARLLVLTNKCKQRWKHYNAIVRTRLYDQLSVFNSTDSTICRPSAWCPLFQSEESSAAQKVYQQISYWKHKGVQDIF